MPNKWKKWLIGLGVCIIIISFAVPLIKKTANREKKHLPYDTLRVPGIVAQEPDGAWRVAVPADQLVVDSTLQVRKNQSITITATGQVTGCKYRYDAAYGWHGPEGWKWSWDARRRRPLGETHTPFMALCAKIGEKGDWFKVGEKKSFQSVLDGKIYFTVNDDIYDEAGQFRPDWIKDNQGSFVVRVKIDC